MILAGIDALALSLYFRNLFQKRRWLQGVHRSRSEHQRPCHTRNKSRKTRCTTSRLGRRQSAIQGFRGRVSGRTGTAETIANPAGSSSPRRCRTTPCRTKSRARSQPYASKRDPARKYWTWYMTALKFILLE